MTQGAPKSPDHNLRANARHPKPRKPLAPLKPSPLSPISPKLPNAPNPEPERSFERTQTNPFPSEEAHAERGIGGMDSGLDLEPAGFIGV